MSDHNYATKFNATKIKLVPIYTFAKKQEEREEIKLARTANNMF